MRKEVVGSLLLYRSPQSSSLGFQSSDHLGSVRDGVMSGRQYMNPDTVTLIFIEYTRT